MIKNKILQKKKDPPLHLQKFGLGPVWINTLKFSLSLDNKLNIDRLKFSFFLTTFEQFKNLALQNMRTSNKMLETLMISNELVIIYKVADLEIHKFGLVNFSIRVRSNNSKKLKLKI